MMIIPHSCNTTIAALQTTNPSSHQTLHIKNATRYKKLTNDVPLQQ